MEYLVHILIWICAGVAADFLTMLYLGVQENQYWDDWCKKKECRREVAPRFTTMSAAKETPWWAHVIIVLIPPSALLRVTM